MEITKQSISCRGGAGQQRIDYGEVVGKILFKQRLAEFILGFEVVVERAFRHLCCSHHFCQADTGIALMGHQRPGDIQDVLACFEMTFFHNAATLIINRPVV
ncbi:hypothetical protein D3C86_1521540 [compost metagenome]